MTISEELLGVSVSLAPGRVTLGVSGDLDSYTAPGLRDAASTALRQDLSLIVDLAEVTFVDGAGLTALLELAKTVRDGNGEFHLHRPPGNVRRLLEITGLTDALPVTLRPESE